MITIFSNPRPFKDVFYNIQMNAIKSWLNIGSGIEVVLLEDEEKTTSQIAREFGLKCIEDAKCNEFGTPLLSSVFEKVIAHSSNDIICQVNADIILTPSFLNGVKMVKDILGDNNFFMSGRRWNLDFNETLDFSDPQWHVKVFEKAKREGQLHGYSGMDYWMFPKKLDFKVPPFVIGRPGMDSWLVYKSRILKIPVIDATQEINIVHQNHPYPKKSQDYFKVEKNRNLKLAGGLLNGMTLRESNYLLSRGKLIKPSFPRSVFANLALFYPWKILLLFKRKWLRK